MHAPERDWAIVGPWWSWPDPARTPTGRTTRPVFQKYATSDPVKEFLADPQRRLRFVPDDVVPQYRRAYVPLRKLPQPAEDGKGKRRVLTTLDALETDPSDGELKSWVDERVPRADGLRKIFLDTHQRFYLVVCQLHCDAPGFPRVRRERICQAGFVVRRRTTVPPPAAAKEARGILKRLATQRARLHRLDAIVPRVRAAGSARRGPGALAVDDVRLDSVATRRVFVEALLVQEQQRLASWAKRFDVAPTLQGWYPLAGLEHVGEWRAVGETPDGLEGESTFPLYPLIPDDADREHAGQFGTVFFGLLPGHLADHEASGRSRFREQEYYEVRCWARRHGEPHDPEAPCPCPGPLFWSPPTEPYWLAGPYDAVGTSQRPVTIHLPDLNDLAADSRPRSGATFSKPPGSLAFGVADQKPTDASRTKGFQICTLPIPLITIIATFVLELFLPVVVFAFGLFWMLRLKLCIPPDVDVGGGLTAELEAQAPSIGAKLDASGRIDVGLTADAAEDAFSLTEAWKVPPPPPTDLDSWVADLLAGEYPAHSEAPGKLRANYSAGAILNWQLDARAAVTTDAPDVTEGLELEEERKHP